MGVFIDEVEGEVDAQPATAPAATAPPEPPDSPEGDFEELQRKMRLLQRRRHRLLAD